MEPWLPWIALLVSAVLIGFMPWRRPDPHHELTLRLVAKLRDTDAARDRSAEVEHLVDRNAVADPDRSSGPGV
jgi:hypothetical protein